MKHLFFPLIITILLFSGCDKIDNPIPTPVGVCDISNWTDSVNSTPDPLIKKIVAEEFTGHLCTFCPDGARELERLDDLFDGQVIPLSIHAGNFAEVLSSTDLNGDQLDDFTTNFNTAEGSDYFSTFGVSANPAATISRLNNATITGLSQWENDINTIKSDIPKLNLKLTNLYDASSRTLKSVVNTEWLSTETGGNFKLQIYLVEDNIIDWQLDNGTYVQFYNHRHVFRTAINGTWGTEIPNTNAGDSETQEYCFTLPSEWDESECSIIAFVYKEGPDYEIYQAEELYLIKP